MIREVSVLKRVFHGNTISDCESHYTLQLESGCPKWLGFCDAMRIARRTCPRFGSLICEPRPRGTPVVSASQLIREPNLLP